MNVKIKPLIKNNMSIKKDSEEEIIYNEEKLQYDNKVKILKREIDQLDDWERDEVFELEVFIDILNKAQEYYKGANYVQKGKIAQILFSNIVVDDQKSLEIQVKPEFQDLFIPNWWS